MDKIIEKYLGKNMNQKVSPASDFFDYVNGSWITSTPIPETESKWGTFYELREELKENLKNIIENLNDEDLQNEDKRKIKDLYDSYMNEDLINNSGLTNIKNFVSMIDNILEPSDLTNIIASFDKFGINTPFGSTVTQDDKKSEEMILTFGQSGLGLPDREYYLKNDEKFEEIRNKYKKHIANMFTLYGMDSEQAENFTESVFIFEKNLAEVHMENTDSRDVDKVYHKINLDELAILTPNINWPEYLKIIGIENRNSDYEVLVYQPKVLRFTSEIIENVSLKEWRKYLLWKVVSGFAGILPNEFAEESFEFYGKTLMGQKEMKPRWKRALGFVEGSIGFALGEIFVEKYFDNNSKIKMDELVNNLRSSYEERINNLDWMSAQTKEKAKIKLHKFGLKIGYPNKKWDFSKLEIKNNDVLANTINSSVFWNKYLIDKLGRPVDREEWEMTPQTVNAYYHPTMNEIVFPAGILQPPFFHKDYPEAWNYGGIGSVIGHEFTHGFDDQGSKYDGDGSVNEWWTDEDREKFESKTKKIVEQYNSFVAIDDLCVNGELTQGENIADLGGLIISLNAYKKTLEYKNWEKNRENFGEWSPIQIFFISYAVTERGKSRDEMTRTQVMTDPHSPSIFRVNGPVVHIDDFHEAFDTKPGDELYLAKEDRVVIW